MKKILVVLIIALFASFSFSQVQNERVKQIEIELKKAKEEEDYEKAADLKQEKELLIELDEVVAKEDFRRAADIKKELAELENKTVASTNSYNYFDYEPESNLGQPGFFLGVSVNYISGYPSPFYSYSYTPSTIDNYIGPAIEIGNKWYFGSNSSYKPGIQVTWIKFNMYVDELYEPQFGLISPLNIGFSNLIPFKKDLGLEINLNVGPTIDLEDLFEESIGTNITPEVRFVIDRFSIGLEYSYYFLNRDVETYNSLGFYEYSTETYNPSSFAVSCNILF